MSSSQPGEYTGKKIAWRERNLTLEVAERLAGGGEGDIYGIKGVGDLAVKIYHEKRRPRGEMAAKLLVMEGIQPDYSDLSNTGMPRAAWPTKVIKNPNRQEVIGTVMPRVDLDRTLPLSQVLNPISRRVALPERNVTEATFQSRIWEIAENIVGTIKALHAAECVIGDVHDENILVDPNTGEICIVDCDAFQIRDNPNRLLHRCKVGRAQYTAPELLEKLLKTNCDSETCRKGREEGPHKADYSCLDRRPEHDMFAIGVLLFRLFMNGTHPYNQKILPGEIGGSLQDHIVARRYPYNRTQAGPRVTAVNAETYSKLPARLKELFQRTFC